MTLYCFDFDGACVGYIDDHGTLFDDHGVEWAELRGNDQVYDLGGQYRGHIDAQGSFLPEHGICPWYVRAWEARCIQGAPILHA